jgi:hypothetical protein
LSKVTDNVLLDSERKANNTGYGAFSSRLPRRWYDKRSSLPEKLLDGVLRHDCTASGISRYIADFKATLPRPDGNQDA